MKKPGHIRIITDKVYFEYHELPLPDLDDFPKHPSWEYNEYYQALQEYEASKRSVEVRNEQYYEKEGKIEVIEVRKKLVLIKNSQPCKAEIIGNKATIVKIKKTIFF